MSNIHGLFSGSDKDKEERNTENDHYVGGVSRHGGSGLNVIPNAEHGGHPSDNMFNLAREHSKGGESTPKTTKKITIYADGLQVDGGPFRLFSDPATKKMSDDLSKGIVPAEFQNDLDPNTDDPSVNVEIVDKRGEKYVPPAAPAYVAFAGTGRTLGGSSSTDTSSSATVSEDQSAILMSSGPVVVDDSQPTTTIQIRTHDGKRMRAKFNLTHTVQDIQRHIATEGAGGVAYTLMAGFPPAPLTDGSLTIEAAGLKGSSITQKLA